MERKLSDQRSEAGWTRIQIMFATVGHPPHHVAPLAHAGAPLNAVGAQQVVLSLPPPLKLGDGLPPPRHHHHH